MDFSEALKAVKSGAIIKREGWNGQGLVVKAQMVDDKSKMTVPYLYIEYPANHVKYPGARCPWAPSQADMMSDDWESMI